MLLLQKMGNKARQYKPSTVRRLDTLSGNVCAAPTCENKLIARDGESIISKICHIEAASDNGPRFNENMDDDDRRHFDNLILLCDECHTIIDNKENEDKYSVNLLKSWKKDHESKLQLSIINKNPTLLNQVINRIASAEIDDIGDPEPLNIPFRIEDKIVHNSIKRNKYLVEEYAKFYPKLNLLYGELESQGSFKKEKLLRNIKLLYTKVKGRFLQDGGTLQNFSDDIFEAMEDELLDLLEEEHSLSDDISFGLPIIMVDSFIRCNILENPNKK